MVGAGLLTVTLNCCVAVAELLSATFAVKLNEPEAVGVPLTRPPLDTPSPEGSVPDTTDQL